MSIITRLKNYINKTDSNSGPEAGNKIFFPFSCTSVTQGVPVIFTNPETHRSKIIIDKDNKILRFPGVAEEDEWTQSLSENTKLKPYAYYGSRVGRYKDKYIMYWTIQPDGSYWADEDGFGGTHDSEITLYSIIDSDGNFTGPFRLYQIGAEIKEIKE